LRPHDLDQFLARITSLDERRMDSLGLAGEVNFVRAENDTEVMRVGVVDPPKMTAVACEQSATDTLGELDHLKVRYRLVGIAGLETRQDIVPQLSQALDALERKVFVRVEVGQGLR
jgi:hypothetical protein